MTVLLTGGLGVIGSWALRALLERGERPVVLDVRPDKRLVHDLEGAYDLEIGDLLDHDLLHRVGSTYGVDRVCHLAAVLPPAAQANPGLGFRVNAVGTVGLLDVARTLGVKRVVYTSSKAVYGPPVGKHAFPGYVPVPETSPYSPADVYGATKLCGELMVHHYREVYGLDTIVLRLASTYGPGKTERHGAVGTVSRIIESAYAGTPISLPQGGDERSDYVYNRDVGRAVALAAFADSPPSRVYNIGTGTPVTLFEIADTVRSLVPSAQITIGSGVGYGEGRPATGSVLDVERAREELGFIAQYSFAEGARDYLGVLAAAAAATPASAGTS